MARHDPDVNAWFERYDNPLKPLVMRVRDIFLEADDRLTETIKWSTPTFAYRGNLVSFQPRARNFVSLLFHTGASIPARAGGRGPRLVRRAGRRRRLTRGVSVSGKAPGGDHPCSEPQSPQRVTVNTDNQARLRVSARGPGTRPSARG